MNMQKRFSSKQKRERSLWSFLRTQLLGKKDVQEVSQAEVNRKKQRIVLGALLLSAVVILLFVVEPSFAQDTSVTKTIANWAIGILAKVVVWLAEQLGYILLFLIELLINIVQYNNFVDATPVAIGWPLIRDTVNMFFIIIVLVSAFATIIGYPKDFHYRQVLPKLLIMAVLINFSKTIIGLLIDFSQVVVLTFVNGFKQAAGGNFVQALGIGKVMRLTDTTGVIDDTGDTVQITVTNSTGANPWSLMSILVAAIFAIWIISISITLILIMLIFFLARIIMLWFLLITSPVAFFAWSLPSALKNALGSFTNEWWSRLSSALVGGPTMAFFLWLSLAMAQRQADLVGPAGLYDPSNVSTEVTQFQQTTQQSQNITPSEFGDPQVFATFIIMVAFMLVGVQASVGFAQKVAPGTEKIVGKLASSKAGFGIAAGTAAGVLAGRAAARGARATGRVAVGGAKLAGRGALAVGREVEGRTGVLAGAANEVRKSKYFALAPMAVQKRFGKIAGAPQKAAKEKVAAIQETMAGMNDAEKMDFLQNQKNLLIGTDGKPKAGVRIADAMAVNLATAQQATNTLTMEQMNKRNKAAARAELGENASEVDIDARAKQMTTSQMSSVLKDARETALAQGDEATAKKIKEMIDKNPALAGDATAMKSQAEKDASDLESERRVKAEAYMHAAYALPFAKAKGWIDDEGRVTAKGRRDDEYKKFMRGKQGQYMNAHLEYAKTDEGRVHVKRILSGKDAAGNQLTDTQLNNQNYTINVSKDGETYHVVQQPPEGTTQPATVVAANRFDKTTDKPEEVLSKVRDESVRSQISNNVQAMETGASDAGAIGTVLAPAVASQLGEDLEELETLQPGLSGAVSGEYEDKRAKMGEKYLSHDVSTGFLFGHDKKTGDFANERGRKAFEDTVTNLVNKITDNGDYSEETLGALASLSKQVGNQGEAFKIMQEKLSNMNQEQIYNSMSTGDPKNQANIQLMYANIIDEAKKQRDSGRVNTTAMRFMNSAYDTPRKTDMDSSEYTRRMRIKKDTQRLLFEGKE